MPTKTKTLTPFEQWVESLNKGTTTAPKIMSGSKSINPIMYQLSSSKFYLSLLTKGIKNRQVKLKDLKYTYGLKGKTATDCLAQFMEIFNKYDQQFKEEKISAQSGNN